MSHQTARRRLAAVLIATLTLLGAVTAAATGTASAATPVPGTPSGLPLAIEPMTQDVGQDSCDPTVKPGTQHLATFLMRTYPGTSWASAYSCLTDGNQSEHYEGRAIDWMTSMRNAQQRADANAFITWLLATDSHGNRFAMARRLGVMYVIWNNRIWGAWNGAWQPYQNCAQHPELASDNRCHRTHVHISLAWNGAMGATSFWTHKVFPTDYGPCPAPDLNWAPVHANNVNLRGCPWHPTVRPPAKASALKKQLVAYSGAGIAAGRSGPIVTAVQRALHIPATGYFDGRTVRAVAAMQKAHHLPGTGSMRESAWRVLLAITP